MKIVNLEEFRKLPEGTVFMKYSPWVFDELSVKGETWEGDFLYENISYMIENVSSTEFDDKLQTAQETGVSVLMDFDFTGRDGCHDKDQLFGVYDKRDIDMLIDKLQRCKKTAYTD